MDTHTSQIMTDSLGRRGGPRRRWPEEAKRKIVEETFKAGASVAIVARRYELNANVVFAWRRLYRARGEIGEAVPDSGAELIPVKVIAPDPGRKRIQKQSRVAEFQTEGIELLLAGGTQVRFSRALAREALREIIAAVCAR
jgi:transposase